MPSIFSRLLPVPLLVLLAASVALAQDAPATRPAGFEHVSIDRATNRVTVDAEIIDVRMPLEFLCVVAGTSEHEAVLRTRARPSDVHAALLVLGLAPGSPASFSPAADRWMPPTGPALRLSVEFDRDGGAVSLPAYRLMRDAESKRPMPPTTWVFSGGRVLTDGEYAGTYGADLTGYVVSVVNFEYAPIDIAEVASSDNETLEWELDPATAPPPGTPVRLVIEPVGGDPAREGAAATRPDTPPPNDNIAPLQDAVDSGANGEDDTTPLVADDARLAALRAEWERAVKPQAGALQRAAQTHYEVIRRLRREQQRLIGEADKIQRLVDELESDYQDLTTPRPEPTDDANGTP